MKFHLNLIENWPLDANQFPIAELLLKAQNFFPRTISGRETLRNKNLLFSSMNIDGSWIDEQQEIKTEQSKEKRNFALQKVKKLYLVM